MYGILSGINERPNERANERVNERKIPRLIMPYSCSSWFSRAHDHFYTNPNALQYKTTNEKEKKETYTLWMIK